MDLLKSEALAFEVAVRDEHGEKVGLEDRVPLSEKEPVGQPETETLIDSLVAGEKVPALL